MNLEQASTPTREAAYVEPSLLTTDAKTLSLIVTATTYLPSLLLGMVILKTGVLDRIQLRSGALLLSVVDRVVDPVAGVAVSLLPSWAVFPW